MIETLDNGQTLLLYLGDELPPEDRLEVQRRLATDESLAAELDRLASMRLEIEDGMARLDKTSGIGLRAQTAARQVAREIRRRQALPKETAATPFRKPRHRATPWLVPVGIAAAVVVGIMVWFHHPGLRSQRQMAMTPASQHQPKPEVVQAEPEVALFEQSFDALDDGGSRLLARADAKKEVPSQDEISRHLLSLDAAQ